MSVPMDQMEEQQEDAQDMEQVGQMLSEEDEQDIDIAVARALEMIADGGEDVIAQLQQGSNPDKQLALFFSQLIEAVMTDPDIEQLGINPAIVLAEGGLIDELLQELGIDADLKPMILENVQKRAGQFAQEGQAPEQTAEPQPPQRRPILAGA